MTELIELKLPETQHRLRPVALDDLVRVGRANDGGYVVARRMIEAADSVLALGLYDDWSFEQALQTLKPELRVDGYDHSISRKHFARAAMVDTLRLLALRGTVAELMGRIATVRSYDRFFSGANRHFPVKITNRPSHDREADLTTALDQLGGRHVLLKMDIEGSEYRVFEQIVDNASRIVGVCLEFHDTEPFRAAFDQAIERLLTKFAIAHVHPNNYGGVAPDGLPDVLEITFVNRDLVDGSECRAQIHLPQLDQPNDVGRPELALVG